MGPISRCLRLLAVAGISATGMTEAQAIQGGTRAQVRDPLARATVAIGTINPSDRGVRISQCSGTLIGPDLVLTAAHCVQNPVGAAVFLYQGSNPIRSPRWVRSIARYTIGSTSLEDISRDIAVLRLSSRVSGRKPIPLARNPKRVPSTLWLAGAGLSSQGSGSLYTAALKPVAVTNTGLTVASAVGSRVCLGDSGGPVVARTARGPVLWGVTSAVLTRSPPCGNIVLIAPAP